MKAVPSGGDRTLMLTGSLVIVAPSASVATAARECAPLGGFTHAKL